MTIPPSNGKVVLVTGINGYIASVVGLHFLSRGYSLRGTTRSKPKGLALLNDAYAPYSSRVEIIEIPDMAAEGAFDQATKGVSSIHHMASPTDFGMQNWDDFVRPATESCVNLLKSATYSAGPQLRSLVFLSSIIVRTDPRRLQSTHVGIERFDVADAKEQGLDSQAAAARMYQASKTMAEKILWQWKTENKPSFAVCSVCPAAVIGPPVQPPTKASGLSHNVQSIWDLMSGEATNVHRSSVNEYVDVRDVAKIQTWCMEHPEEAAAQRYIASAGHGPPQAAADILRKAYPDREAMIPRGDPGQGYRPDFGFLAKKRRWNGTCAADAMNLKYTRYDQSVVETARVLERYLVA